MDKVFEACRVKGKCGISIAKGDVFAGAAICYKPDSVTFISCEGLITEEYLVSKIKELDCEIYTINLKIILNILQIHTRTKYTTLR